jgi:monofunctional biosynthetic peptidoglycan transglycosylase
MRSLWRWLGLCTLALLCLQLYFIGHIALMAALDPQSTAFQRSEAWRIQHDSGHLPWAQQWVAYGQLPDHLKRAVIASEDDGFSSHDGVDWAALKKAWNKNSKAEQRAELKGSSKPPKVVGGSTITQQLAKNLFLSGERTLFRKAQEFVLTLALEALLGKQRILEIYLNSVEWGEGVFGAEAAAQHYFRKPAARLSAYEAARLVVMLPRPKYFEKTPNSTYLSGRAGVIAARMGEARLP